MSANTGRVRPYVFGGPEVSVKSGAKLTAKTGGLSVDHDDFASTIRRANAAIDAGAGLEIPAGRVSVFVEGLYSYGLLNIKRPDERGDSAWIDSVKTRGFLMTTGVRF